MTVNQNDRYDIFVGDGVTSLFSVSFRIGSTAGLQVLKRDKDNNSERTLTLGPDYSLDVVLQTVLLLGGESPLQSNEDLVVDSTGVFEQLNDFTNLNFINSTTAELTWDTAIAFIQELAREKDLSLRGSPFTDKQAGPVTPLPFAEAEDVGRFLSLASESPLAFAFSAASDIGALPSTALGESILNAPTPTDVQVLIFNAYMQGFVAQATAEAARRELVTDELVILTDDGNGNQVTVANEDLGDVPVDFKPVDISSFVRAGHTARFALIRAQIICTQVDTVASRIATLGLRKTGTTPAQFQQVECAIGSTELNDRNIVERGFTVPLDTNERFDYEVKIGSAIPEIWCEVRIDLEGYLR